MEESFKAVFTGTLQQYQPKANEGCLVAATELIEKKEGKPCDTEMLLCSPFFIGAPTKFFVWFILFFVFVGDHHDFHVVICLCVVGA